MKRPYLRPPPTPPEEPPFQIVEETDSLTVLVFSNPAAMAKGQLRKLLEDNRVEAFVIEDVWVKSGQTCGDCGNLDFSGLFVAFRCPLPYSVRQIHDYNIALYRYQSSERRLYERAVCEYEENVKQYMDHQDKLIDRLKGG